MKFDDQLFNLSAEVYNKIKNFNNNTNEEVKRKQDIVLKILLTKFKEQLKLTKDIDKVILKVKFESKFWSDFNDGYREINELVNSENFDYFAGEYCMYIGDVNYTCDEYQNAYYEIIWDYKTYFEQLRTNHVVKKVVDEKRKQEIQAKKEFCKINGHNFGEWKENRWTTLEEHGPSGIEALFTGVGTMEVEHIKWSRRCKNCGSVQTTSKKPKEIEAAEIEEQINTLQKRLDTIKK